MVGIIGGTGLGQALAAGNEGEWIHVDTPFGMPSSPVLRTQLENQTIFCLPRHGEGHRFNPTGVPYRANIYALKKLGVTHIIASGATGSLREEFRPQDVVIVDQVIDRTYRRDSTFFDHGLAVHVEFAQPFCPALRSLLNSSAEETQATVHDGGTYVCMEGPQFSTVAESNLHRSWGGDLIGMTCMPEAKLAREAEMCYALIALPTDYDCWRPHAPGMTPNVLLEEIGHNLQAATVNAIELIRAAITRGITSQDTPCTCRDALKLGIWTDKSKIDATELEPLRLLLEKYVSF